jgi:hypothetical protein
VQLLKSDFREFVSHRHLCPPYTLHHFLTNALCTIMDH